MTRLQSIASELRRRLVKYSHDTGTPHLGSCLSCVEILVTCYFDFLDITKQNISASGRDYLFLSKGHAAPALFHSLALKGVISESELMNSRHDGQSFFGEHPPARGHVPGVEFATGSLGHGFGIALGVSVAGPKLGWPDNKVVCILGDGECDEGSVWETAGLSSALAPKNFTVFVDKNDWQGTDRTRNIFSSMSLAGKWAAFGWQVLEVDGHDFSQIKNALETPTIGPKVIIANTVKGKGISFMEDDNNWHYRVPNAHELDLALQELQD